jgi:hypothetical protein
MVSAKIGPMADDDYGICRGAAAVDHEPVEELVILFDALMPYSSWAWMVGSWPEQTRGCGELRGGQVTRRRDLYTKAITDVRITNT